MYLPLSIPPGLIKANTLAQGVGRYIDGLLCRGYGREIGPIGGWVPRSDATVTGIARSLLAWKADNEARHIVMATASKLYAQSIDGTNFDITPVGFLPGNTSSKAGQGYGGAGYGTGGYGVPRPDVGVTSEATVIAIDIYGQTPVFLSPDDGVAYVWELDPSTPAIPVTNAPVEGACLCVTNEGALMIGGAGGDSRKVAWSDLRNITQWTPDATNQAGDFDINTKGSIRRLLRLQDCVLILTDFDAWRATYAGAVYVYGFDEVGTGCGVISRGCAIPIGQQAYWMSRSGIWFYDGQSCQLIECAVSDILRTGINFTQAAKISGAHNPQFNEVFWDYPSPDSDECDRRLRYNYHTGEWWDDAHPTIGKTCSCEPGPFKFPMSIGTDGKIYEHETGHNYDGLVPFVETGPIFDPTSVIPSAGDNVLKFRGIINDEGTFEGVQVSFFTRPYPNGDETTIAPVTMSGTGYTCLRFSSRLTRMRITFPSATMRLGDMRLDVHTGGHR